MSQIVIAGYARSAFQAAHKGKFIHTRPDELAAEVIKGLVQKTQIDPDAIEDLILGCAFPEGEQGLNAARLIGFLAELPLSVAGQTINRFCGSSMQALHSAVGSIASGAGDVFIAAGVESMTRVPMTGFNPLPHPELYDRYPQAYESMGITAENLASLYKIRRKHQDAFALQSHQKATEAHMTGHFENEIVEIHGVCDDGCIRQNANMEELKKLKPAFDQKGSVTAGTSSPLTDGASALLVCSLDYARAHQLDVLASVRSMAVSGCEPEIMGIGPVGASHKALARAGLTLKDIDIIELNEAFAAQALAVIRELDIDEAKLNLDGGAIALGHPLGASGARIVGKAASLLKRENKSLALATMCIGGGQGIATVLESV